MRTRINEGWQAVLARLLQGELLASVNDSLEALGLPRGSSPPPLSKGQRWLAAHGLSTDLPTGTASLSKSQQHSAGAVSLPHSSAQQLIPCASEWSLGIAPAALSCVEGAAQRQGYTAPEAVRSDIIVGAESIQPRSAESYQLQMLQYSTSDDTHLVGDFREAVAAAQSPQISSMVQQQGNAAVPAANLPDSQASKAAASTFQQPAISSAPKSTPLGTFIQASNLVSTEPQPLSPELQSTRSELQSVSHEAHKFPLLVSKHFNDGIDNLSARPEGASSGTDLHSGPDAAACVAVSATQRLESQHEDTSLCSSSTACGAQQATSRDAAETPQADT